MKDAILLEGIQVPAALAVRHVGAADKHHNVALYEGEFLRRVCNTWRSKERGKNSRSPYVCIL